MFGLEVIRGASAHVTLARASRVALPYSCGLMERGTGLVNTCNVSDIVNMENLIFFSMLRCLLHIQLKMSVNNYRYKG